MLFTSVLGGQPPAISPAADSAAPPLARRAGCTQCATRAHCIIGGDPALRASLEPFMRERRVAAGTLLKRQGEMSGDFVIIKTGMAFICHGSEQGQARPVAVAGRGLTLGMCSYLQQPNQVTCIAVASSRVCTLPTRDVARVAQASRDTEARVLKIIAENYALLARWAEAIGANTIPVRVASAIQLLAQQHDGSRFALPSHVALAELLGTTRESVARAVALLEAGGCLRRADGRRCEVDARRLREWLAQHR